jgi:hypothetical protein
MNVGRWTMCAATVAGHTLLAVGCGGQTRAAPSSGEFAHDASTLDENVSVQLPDAAAGDSRPEPSTPEERAIRAVEEAGYARGWNLCACLAPEIVDRDGCARDESGIATQLFRPATERCALDLARASSAFTEYLSCQANHLQLIANCEKANCTSISTRCSGDALSERPCEPLSSDLQKQWDACVAASG